jgi:hypothetical protein
MSGEATFLANILQGSGNHDDEDDFLASDAGSSDDNDAEQFSTVTIHSHSAEDESHSDHSNARPTDVRVSVPPSAPRTSNVPAEISVQNPPAPPLPPAAVNHPNVPSTATGDESLPISHGKSLAHHYIRAKWSTAPSTSTWRRVLWCRPDLGTALLTQHCRLNWPRLHP